MVKDKRPRCPACLRQETSPYGSIVDYASTKVDLYRCNREGCGVLFLPFVVPGFALREAQS